MQYGKMALRIRLVTDDVASSFCRIPVSEEYIQLITRLLDLIFRSVV